MSVDEKWPWHKVELETIKIGRRSIEQFLDLNAINGVQGGAVAVWAALSIEFPKILTFELGENEGFGRGRMFDELRRICVGLIEQEQVLSTWTWVAVGVTVYVAFKDPHDAIHFELMRGI